MSTYNCRENLTVIGTFFAEESAFGLVGWRVVACNSSPVPDRKVYVLQFKHIYIQIREKDKAIDAEFLNTINTNDNDNFCSKSFLTTHEVCRFLFSS